jgi:hypothetical protein
MESLSVQLIRLGSRQRDTCLILQANTASLSQNQRRVGVGHIYITKSVFHQILLSNLNLLIMIFLIFSGKLNSVLTKMNMFGRKADGFAHGVREHGMKS